MLLQVLVPPLRDLETYIFESMYRLLWDRVVAEGLAAEVVIHSRGNTPTKAGTGSPTHGLATHDAAVQRWTDALQVMLLSTLLS